MNTFEIHECPNPSQPLGLGSSKGLGAWVPAHERQPSDGELVAVYCAGASMCDVWPARWCARNKSFQDGYGLFEQDEVTHWMLLPAPPQVVSDAPNVRANRANDGATGA
jgi:hypothetical protein